MQPINSNISAVIFDMGGVFLRSMDTASRERQAARFGITRQELEATVFAIETADPAARGNLPEQAHWEAIGRRLGLRPEEMPSFQEEFFADDRVDYDLLGFLNNLRPAIKTGLLSNAWPSARWTLTERFPCLQYFDVSIFSCEVGLLKPDARIYQLILERLEVPAQAAVFLDDFPENVAGAQAVGMHAVQFLNPEQAKADLSILLGLD